MDISESAIRTLRKKARAWLVSLTYYSARGKANLDTFSQRLQPLFKHVLKPDILQEIIKGVLPVIIETKEATCIKYRIMSIITPDKIEKRLLSFPKIRFRKAPEKSQTHSFTLGRFVIIWAVLTNQPVEDFMVMILPNVNRLCRDWHNATGCSGLSDEECSSHPKETVIFWSGFYRILIQATPEEHLIQFMQTGIQTLEVLLETSGMDKTIVKLTGQVSRLVTKETAQKIELALKENPYARERISISELQALVLREEIKLGWSSNTQQDTQEILREGLSPELKEAIDNKQEVIRSSMETVGRRGLFNNLFDALNGQLRPRFVESIKRILKSIAGIKSHWEFSDSRSATDDNRNILQWLFRRD